MEIGQCMGSALLWHGCCVPTQDHLFRLILGHTRMIPFRRKACRLCRVWKPLRRLRIILANLEFWKFQEIQGRNVCIIGRKTRTSVLGNLPNRRSSRAGALHKRLCIGIKLLFKGTIVSTSRLNKILYFVGVNWKLKVYVCGIETEERREIIPYKSAIKVISEKVEIQQSKSQATTSASLSTGPGDGITASVITSALDYDCFIAAVMNVGLWCSEPWWQAVFGNKKMQL